MFLNARILFTVAAFFNFSVGIVFLFAMPQLANFIGMTPLPSDPVFLHFGAVVVLAFGWGYLQVAFDPVVNRPIIKLGVVAKLLVVLAGFSDWLLGYTNGAFPSVLVADIVFVVLFSNYLRLNPIVSNK